MGVGSATPSRCSKSTGSQCRPTGQLARLAAEQASECAGSTADQGLANQTGCPAIRIWPG